MKLSEQLETQYQAQLGRSQGAERVFREAAWSRYHDLGLPTRKTEAWKYSNIASLEQTVWQRSRDQQTPTPPAAQQLMREWKAEFDIALVVDGQLRLNESSLNLESGYELQPNHNFTAPQEFSDGLAWATAATHQGGFDLRVADGAQIGRPLLIIHCQTRAGSMASTLNRITIGRGAHFALAEVFISDSGPAFCSHLARIELQADSYLTWVASQEMQKGTAFFFEAQARQERGSRLESFQSQSGADWSRGTLKVEVAGEGAEARLNGLSFGRDSQHIDQRVEVYHMAPNSLSAQLYKGVLKDRSRGILNGKIHIARHAQKVVSSQLNHNLLLSPGAEADTKPELEIYADDVKANHGASCGRLDGEKLFYLQSRGIPADIAQQMLAQAFVADIVMKVPAAAGLRAFFQSRLPRKVLG
jgi:Fe-S cluster assembly protein SufD